MPWFTLENGRRIFFEERGQGRPLVLLHGWCMSSRVWQPQLEGLAGSFCLFAPDLAGHGLRGHVIAAGDGFTSAEDAETVV